MLSLKTFVTISSVLFGILALVHLLRAIVGFDFIVGTFSVPIAGSWIVFLILGYLAFAGMKLIPKG